jgi:F-type H+-transporting ATPase subunit delta
LSDSKIARRYARALSELCDASGDHVQVGQELQAFADTYRDSAELQGVLKNPTVDLALKQSVLSAVLNKLNTQKGTHNFLLVLLDRGRIEVVEDVAKAFQAIVDIAAKRLRATVTSSVPMADSDLDRVRTALGRLTGQTVTLDARVDAELIGGAQVQIGNVLLDSSIRSHLDKLRDQLVN